jgi:hypothetical protein
MLSPIAKATETAVRHEYTFFSISRDCVFNAVTTIFVPFNSTVIAVCELTKCFQRKLTLPSLSTWKRNTLHISNCQSLSPNAQGPFQKILVSDSHMPGFGRESEVD